MHKKPDVKELVILSLLGPLLFVVGDLAFELLPNIHLVGVMLVVITAVYRARALYPLYVYVLLNGILGGFSPWWIPYLYVWTVLWAAVMLLPRRVSPRVEIGLYVAVCAAHGYLFGVLYAPSQLWLLGLDWNGMLAWIAVGLPYDLIHGTANLILGVLLIPPLLRVLRRLQTTGSV